MPDGDDVPQPRQELPTILKLPLRKDAVAGTVHAVSPLWRLEIESEESYVPDVNDSASPGYFYTRSDSARRSLAANFGVVCGTDSVPLAGLVDTSDLDIDVYLKATTTTCIRHLMAVTVGRGILDLPAAMALCGFLPGFLLLGLVASQNIFFMHRTVEAPQVFRRSLEHFEDIAFQCFGSSGFRFVACFNILALHGIMMKVFEHELVSLGKQLNFINIGNFDMLAPGFFEFMVVLPMLTLCLTPFAFRTSAKALHVNSTISVFTSRIITVILCVSSAVHLIKDWGNHHYVPINTSVDQQLEGFSLIVHAFLGPMLLPSILADMMNPADAKRVCNTVMRETLMMYSMVASFGYFGCATKDAKLASFDFFKVLSSRGNLLTRVVRVLFTLKNFTTFPLLFCPWRRLIESLICHGEQPAIELGVPWALQRIRHRKTFLRLLLMLLAPLVYTILRFMGAKRAFQVFYCAALYLPMATSMYLFPALFTARLWVKSYDDDCHAEESPFFFPLTTFCFSKGFSFWSSSRDTNLTRSTPGTMLSSTALRARSLRPWPRIEIDLPPSMVVRERTRKIRFGSISDSKLCGGYCSSWASDLNEELSLLNPAWAKTWKANLMIGAICLTAAVIWVASLVYSAIEFCCRTPRGTTFSFSR